MRMSAGALCVQLKENHHKYQHLLMLALLWVTPFVGVAIITSTLYRVLLNKPNPHGFGSLTPFTFQK